MFAIGTPDESSIEYSQPKETGQIKMMLCYGERLRAVSWKGIEPSRERKLDLNPTPEPQGFPTRFPAYPTFMCGAQEKIYGNLLGKLERALKM